MLNCVKCVEKPLPSYFDIQYFTLDAMENFNYAKISTKTAHQE